MAKSNFSNGDFVTPNFMNSLYLTGDGHLHDGVDSDGHASKIDINSHTTGTLLGSRVAIQARNYIDGLQISWNQAALSWTVSIAAGAAMDSTNTVMMTNTSTFTKSLIDSTGLVYDPFVVGGGLGGCEPLFMTPIAAGIWVHVFILGALDNGVVVQSDAGFDTDVNATRLISYASGYMTTGNIVYRRVGSVLLAKPGSYYTITKFIQTGDIFVWAASPTVFNATVATTPSFTTITSITPLGVTCKSWMHCYVGYYASGNTIHLIDGIYPTSTTSGHFLYVPSLSGAATDCMIEMVTGVASDIYAFKNSASNNPTLVLHGIRYQDFRGRQ